MRLVTSLSFVLLPFIAFAQEPGPAAAPPSFATGSSAVQEIHLGRSLAALTGPWKFHTGDNPTWSKPGFDDSSWTRMDMTAETDPDDPSQMAPLPGWTARGFPGYSGFAWYRLQVDVQGQGRPLSLKMPDTFDDAYQVFVNGVQIGEFGRFNGRSVTAYATSPRAFRLPKSITGGKLTIAVRMWMDSATRFSGPDVGGLHDPPMLGYVPDIATQVRLGFDDISHAVGSGFLEALILFMALLMAVALYWLDREEDAYLWLALVCLVTLLGNSVLLLSNYTTIMGATAVSILSSVVATPVRIGLWVMFWAYWFRLPRLYRFHFVAWTLVVLLAIGTAMLRPPLFGQTIPVAAEKILIPATLVLKLGLGLLLGVIAFQGFERRRAEGGMAAAAIMLAFVANFQHELRLIHLSMTTTVFGFSVSTGTISTILSLLIITVMLLRRFVYSERMKEQWKVEIEQARGVQQVIVPDKLPVIKGLNIRSAYHPAREVGGDFFQILPLEGIGNALIVVGDVTGKGVQAGMLVALIVGAIRSVVQQTQAPDQILCRLNDQLCEREQAGATCMVMRISGDGLVQIAHAGHVPPYLNDQELKLEGALPLGMFAGVDFSSETFRLKPGDTLTLFSDGVSEAQDSHGQLFGFERVHEMMSGPVTAAEIAAAAESFGQEDDITVLQVQWEGLEPAREMVAEPQLAAL